MKILRALFISAVATGIAAGVLSVLSRREPAPAPTARPGSVEGFSEAEEQMLLKELSEQL